MINRRPEGDFGTPIMIYPANRGSGNPLIPSPVTLKRLPALNCGLFCLAKRSCAAGCDTLAIDVTKISSRLGP